MTGIVIPDGGTIGSTSDTDAIAISSSGIVTMASGNGYRLNSIQTFTDPSANGTATNTWNKPVNVTAVLVYVTGGGGGGGAGTANYNEGGGGHAGGTAIKWITPSTSDGSNSFSSMSTVTVTVGNYGTGSSTGNGNIGGTSSFGNFCSATGGQGGRHASNGAQYSDVGVGSGGDINIDGGFGDGHHTNNQVDSGGPGNGGASFWGGGGGGANHYHAYYGTTGRAWGSGGGGGAHNSTHVAGKEGHEGIVIVWEYVG